MTYRVYECDVYLLQILIIKSILGRAIFRKLKSSLLVFLGLIHLHYRPRVMKKNQVSCIRRSQLCNGVFSSSEDAL